MLSDISSWIMSIAGIICLSVIVELVLPDGQLNRYIKGIFSFIILLVIISPIKESGYQNVVIYINCDIFDNAMQFKSIFVDLKNIVITENAEHTNITKIKEEITSIIKSHVDIDEEAILYDG